MDRLDEFRIYYNHTIHPELLRLERKRRRLLWIMFASCFLLFGIILLEIYVNVFFITMLLMIPLSLYITLLFYQMRNFVVTFKPRVVNLILDFIEPGKFEYHPKKFISKSDFKASNIFASDAPSYAGEDYIKGHLGDVFFEMSELNVKEYSKVRSRLNYVFRGVLLKADFGEKFTGGIYVLPEEFQQYLTNSIKKFTKRGAEAISLDLEEFEEAYMVYATQDAPVHRLLSLEVQQLLVNYREHEGKKIYMSFIQGTIYIAVTEPKDLLEPYLFQSNVSFQLVKEFYEDLQLIFSIVEDFDLHQ